MDEPRIPKPGGQAAQVLRAAQTTLPAAQPPAPAPSAPAPGRRRLPSMIDDEVIAEKYRLVRRLSEGGMGTLWLAHHEALDVECALKVIRADVAELEQDYLNGRLFQEARAAARLGHPAIVRVMDVGRTSQGDAFMVMELLRGEDLGSVLVRRGRFPAESAVQVLLPIIHALACAHDKGIVHRDVKPENIFIARAEDGAVQPKLVDFGVAKLRDGAERLTAAGAVLGTPGYMSPEQARGSESHAAADIWATCVILHELVTGDRPFRGTTYAEVVYSITEDEPARLVGVGPGEAELGAIVRRGLSKAPEERWPSMRDLGGALAGWLLDRDVETDVCGAPLEAEWLRPRDSIADLDTFDAIAAAPRRSTHRALPSPAPLASAPPRPLRLADSGTRARPELPVPAAPAPLTLPAAPTEATSPEPQHLAPAAVPAAHAGPPPRPAPLEAAEPTASRPVPSSLPEPSSWPRPAPRQGAIALATWQRSRPSTWLWAGVALAALVAVGATLIALL